MSWKNPSYTAEKKFHRLMALGFSNKANVRADFEDALATRLSSQGYETIPGNTILLRPPGTQLDLNYLREQMRANQIEAVVVSRLIKVDESYLRPRHYVHRALSLLQYVLRLLRHPLPGGLLIRIFAEGKEGTGGNQSLCRLRIRWAADLDRNNRYFQSFRCP